MSFTLTASRASTESAFSGPWTDWYSPPSPRHPLRFDLSAIQIVSQGGCVNDWFPDIINQWDYVRYGTLGFGERIVAADSPAGTISEQTVPALDSLTVTFDAPHFVHTNRITVQSTGGTPRALAAVRRRARQDVNTIDIVLEQLPPVNRIACFIFHYGWPTQVVVYAAFGVLQGACCLPDTGCQNLTRTACGLIPGSTVGGTRGNGADTGLVCRCAPDTGRDDAQLPAPYVGGPRAPDHTSCTFADLDRDGDVDLQDHSALQNAEDAP